MLHAPGARNRELTCNPPFSDFLSSELLPWAHGLFAFNADPHRPWSAVPASEAWPPPAQACITPNYSETSSRSRDPSFWVPPKSDGSDSDREPEPHWVAEKAGCPSGLPARNGVHDRYSSYDREATPELSRSAPWPNQFPRA